MGGRSSKVDTYVLHAEPEKVEQLQPYQSRSSKKGGPPPLTTQSSVLATDRESGSVNTGMTRGKSSAKMEKQISSAVLEKQSSVAALGATGRRPSQNSIIKSGSFVANQSPSTKIRKVPANGSTTCSSEYPWLLKNGKFNGSNLKDYEQGRILGRGFMGTVRLVKTKGDKYVVFKCVKKDQIVKKKTKKHIDGEKQVLNTLNSVFCIKLFGTFQDKHYLYFALEYAAGGELCHHLDKKLFFEPEVAKFYISEVFCALEHVQSLGFVYRDLKPENIMLDEDGHCKLVDFGFTTSANSSSGKLHTMCGTAAYLSPEQLDGKFTNGYTNIVDWWSFGVLIYELRTGETPFCKSPRDTNYEIFLRILKKRISFPFRFDTKSKELIKSLCYADLAKRLCAPEDIKKHSYFELPWSVVQERRLVPPIKPKLNGVGDSHYFPQFFDDKVPSTGAESVGTAVTAEPQEINGGGAGGEFFDF